MESVLKRYFPVMIKPIALVLLVFIAISWSFIIFQVLSPISPERIFIDPNFTPEVRESLRELFGLDEPLYIRYLQYVKNMLTWNFGISFETMRPVAEEIFWRLPNTLLLIGLSSVLSMSIGVGLSALMSVFKPGRRRPSTFAHSLRGFFFGPVPFLALLSMFFFSYYAYATWGFNIFPSRGMFSIPPPTDPFAYMVDVAWHLALPVTVLVVFNMARVVLTVWSSGLPFTSKKMLKSAILPITTTDFTFMISAIIFVEYLFTLPGIGQWFLTALMQSNYPVIMASLVVFVEIAVCLGFISVLFDFLQRFVSLRDDLDKKITTESEISSSQTGVHKNPAKHVLRRKSVILGSAIVIAFLLFAIFAPFITPYDPLASERVADSFAMPAWVTVFPQYKNLSTTRTTTIYWEVEEEWMYAHVQEWGRDISVEFRAETTDPVTITFICNYPYSQPVPPNAFYCDFKWRAQGVRDLKYLLKLFVVDPNGTSTMLWIIPGDWQDKDSGQAVYVDSTNWELLQRLGLKLGVDNLAHEVFNVQEGNYTFVLEMLIRPEATDAECEISFTDTTFVTLGHVHGILGCDNAGADIWAQLVYGARTMAMYVFLTAFLAVILGFPFGFLSGYFQGWADNVIMLLTDTLLCLPILPILLVNIMLFGKSIFWFLPFFLLFLSALAAKAFRNMFIVRPSDQKFKGKTGTEKALNTFKDLFLNICLTAMSFVLLLPAIDFLGFGDPRVPSWGKILHHAFGFGGFSHLAWWWLVPPIICIALLALGFLLLGAGLEDG